MAKELRSTHARVAALTRHRNDQYEERTALLVALSRVYPAHLLRAANNRSQPVLCIHNPDNDQQMAWLLFGEQREAFAHLKDSTLEAHDPDGHSKEERVERLLALGE